MQRSRWRPSPALIVACLALFVALGGTVLAATKISGRTIKVKSLPGNRLEVGSLPGNRLQPGTVSGSRLAPKSVTGKEIDTATLAQVPSAAQADSATTARHAETATAADHAADATTINGRAVGCDEGQMVFAGACWDLAPSAIKVPAMNAVARCLTAGGELPQSISLRVFLQQSGVTPSTAGEWTNQISSLTPGYIGLFALEANDTYAARNLNEELQFRCVTPLLN
jgi:hypothetical protein